MKYLATAITVGLLILTSAGVANASEGKITDAKFNASTSTVSVSNMRVVLTGCGSDEIFTVYCGALAGVAKASESCPSGGTSQDLPAELTPLWQWGYTLVGGIVDSGFQDAPVPGPAVYRVCLYTNGYEQGGAFGGTSLLASADTQALPREPKLTKRQATRAAKRALKRKFGKKFKRGKATKIRCKPKRKDFSCKVSWKLRKARYKGTVKVSGSPKSPSTKVRVKKVRKRR